MASDFLVPFLAFVFVSTLALLFLRQTHQRYPYPPGPPPKPLIGNALDVPSEKPCTKYLNWSREFNSVFTYFSTHVSIQVTLSAYFR